MSTSSTDSIRHDYPLWMTHAERAKQLGIGSSTLAARMASKKHPPLTNARFYGPAMKAFDEAEAAAVVPVFRQTLAKDGKRIVSATPIEPVDDAIAQERRRHREAVAVARSFMKAGVPPSDQPFWRNMRLCSGDVPADVRAFYGLNPNSDFVDVYAAITRDPAELAGRRMIEKDEADAKRVQTQRANADRAVFEDAHRAERRADVRARRNSESGK